MSLTQPCTKPHAASFRDPSGFIFRNESGQLLRQVNLQYEPHYVMLQNSGLYDELIADALLVEHSEVALEHAAAPGAFRVLQPVELPFISYPYEWAFSALQDAALLTLDIQKRAINRGMTLKDASAYNVQFTGAKPVFIDTLSLESYEEGKPWDAYGQFCRHFLAPLALMSRVDISLQRLMALHLDGVPLDLACKLLPWSSKLSLNMQVHLYWHSRMISRHADDAGATQKNNAPGEAKKPAGLKFSRSSMNTLLDSLTSLIESFTWKAAGTEWADYYNDHSYSDDGLQQKERAVSGYLDAIDPGSVWDLGANTGVFSRLASGRGVQTVALDIDPACVERNYLAARHESDNHLQPICMDLSNPSSGIGWAHAERDSLAARGPCDAALALALVHHLAISNNAPLQRIAEMMRSLCKNLIIEWVPKTDPQVKRLLSSRRDIFPGYHKAGFEEAFRSEFDLLEQQEVGDDGRVVYLMRGI